ncbi:MAG: MnmC family methyltransferase [Campylobacterota bacterium]|nr:MnmC family methyltransferase [Campylobacterota bacterium]
MYNESLRAEKRRVVTEDGSVTLFSAEFDELYHSDRDGALNESLQKHVLPAFRFKGDQAKLTILDICFGLGYNTLATLYYLKKMDLSTKVHIVSPEFDKGLIESLSSFDYPNEFALFKPIIKQLSKAYIYEDEQFKIEIVIGDARKVIPEINEKFDVVYQDAFSPQQNPLLWTREYFAQLRSVVNKDALLTTYSTAASVRMGLHENGFHLFEIPNKNMRDSMVASLEMLDAEHIDMELKKKRNPDARSLHDAMFLDLENS